MKKNQEDRRGSSRSVQSIWYLLRLEIRWYVMVEARLGLNISLSVLGTDDRLDDRHYGYHRERLQRRMTETRWTLSESDEQDIEGVLLACTGAQRLLAEATVPL